jgi:hypothetical protein
MSVWERGCVRICGFDEVDTPSMFGRQSAQQRKRVWVPSVGWN